MPREAVTSSSITTAVPSGVVSSEWCIQNLLDWDDFPNHCADSDEHPSDYSSICCAGSIVDTESNLFSSGSTLNRTVNLDTLVCCIQDGPQQGGILPFPNDPMACPDGSPTPLASFAATNTANAAVYEVTYTSASQSAGESTTVTGDYIPRKSPMCLWVNTKSGVAMTNVTVAAADITTLPAPTTDKFGWTITTGSLAPTSTVDSETSSTAAAASTTSTSGAGSAHGISSTASLFILALGLYRAIRA
ncbi:hypothetical protein Q7P35_000247 [Cladosporium inversicolor]